ncbi:hypothetical protein ES703_11207 [subsurface metagenome]
MKETPPFKKIIIGNESSFYITPHTKKPVNLYKLIRKLNLIIKLQKQGVYLVAQEIEELKG